ncbi:MAG: T9SS type A sorting domain-containing protein [Bacteroidetes bacterium]|nr:T9SS type A sorting domain-containing protein [Bacteroidota bacterium]
MSSKFGIAIQNDLYTHDANGYDNFVAGIGRSSSDLNDCAASGSLIQLSNPTDLDAGEYLLFGYNLESGGTTESNPDSIYSRWNRNLKFEETGDVGAVDIIFNLDQADFTVNDEDDLHLMIDTDGDGDMSDAQIIHGTYNSTSNTVTYSGIVVNNDALYTMGSPTPANALPVEFLYIKATQERDVNKIDWATAMEENNSHFIVQRTHDGASWESLTEIGGAGFSSNVLKYEYIDMNPYMDVNYYRIMQVDYDGKYDYSDIVMVNSLVQQADINLKVFPNPATDKVQVQWGENEETGKVVVLGLNGKVVAEQLPDQHNNTTIDLTSIKDGVYFIQFIGTTTTKTERLVVRH